MYQKYTQPTTPKEEAPKRNSRMRTVVDVHTHFYPRSYVSLLKSRQTVPFIRFYGDSDTGRLVILPGENDDTSKAPEARGRPVGPAFWDIKRKLAYMDAHGIDISVVSLANPWLDFLPPEEAAGAAKDVNDNLEEMCEQHTGRLYGFGALPLSGGASTVVEEVKRLKTLKHMRGVIMGTSGFGNGLDDPALDPVYDTLQETKTLIFLHPHYGLPPDVFGPRANESGHVMPLALGFPLETTIAITRMFLSRVFDRFPDLQVLLAHSGGTLPFLAGRIQYCLDSDLQLKQSPVWRRSLWHVLKHNIYLDAVTYSNVALASSIEASGADRLMFGESFQ